MHTKTLFTILVGALLLLLLWGGVTGLRPTGQVEDGSPAAPTQHALGAAVYVAHCASCHGPELEGQPNWKTPNADGTFKAPPHDASGHTWHHSDAYLIDRIRNGTAALDPGLQPYSNMPAYDAVLTDEEILAVLAYIKASWPEDVQRMQAEQTQSGG